jgi:proline iminopeptidase
MVMLIIVSGKIYSQQNGMVMAADSTAIYYRTFGTGKPLLIINGGPGMNSDGFQGLATTLSSDFRTIIFDQRGTGKSVLKNVDSTTITMALMISDMESLRKQLGLEKWSVLGHSFGGMVASAYASVHPEVIDRIVLSSSGGIDLDLLDYFRASLNSKLTTAQREAIEYWAARMDGEEGHYARLQRAKILAHAYVLDTLYYPVIAERLTQINPDVNQLMWDNLRRSNFDCREQLQDVTIPVLIIQGKQDLVRPQTAEDAGKAFRNSRIVYMDHCIHYGWLDNPEVYFNEVINFLRA